ncbi:MAG: hypothetical protein PWQ60_431 [Thermoanaerobacteraceae bacterium]|nr:hypothetical protein [Thermoanaerobacteraceae bacterium]
MEQWKSQNWWVSKYNYLETFRRELNLPSKVEIHDATLRDGEQTPGVVFTIEDKVNIAKMLDEIGVDRIEAGMPAVSSDDAEAIKRIAKLGLKARIFAFCRGKKEDIDLAKECGVDGVIIEMPTSYPKLKFQFSKWSEDDVINISTETVKYAKELGLETVFFGYDTTRANWEFLQKLYEKIIAEGNPDSIGIVDTMGCILPGAMKEFVKKIKAEFNVKLEVHTHNELGMATANSLSAVEAGVEVVHTCINGLGERTGNAPLEETIVGLKVLLGYNVNYKFDKIKELSEKVEEISNFQLAKNKPIVGKNIFVRESGIGIELVTNTPLAMFPLNPPFIGNKAGVVLGKKSGLKSIDVKAEELGITVPEDKKQDILARIKHEAIEKKRTLTDEEFKAIVEEFV